LCLEQRIRFTVPARQLPRWSRSVDLPSWVTVTVEGAAVFVESSDDEEIIERVAAIPTST
jgi:hypothetical protein